MENPVKVCPTCFTNAPLDAAECTCCGHRYRTKFVDKDPTLELPAQPALNITEPSKEAWHIPIAQKYVSAPAPVPAVKWAVKSSVPTQPSAATTSCQNNCAGCFIVILVITVLGAIIGEPKDKCNSSYAKYEAENVVRSMLKAPKTADFSNDRYTRYGDLDTGGCYVSGDVDAQNGFGAMLRSHYIVKFDKDNHVLDFQLQPQ